MNLADALKGFNPLSAIASGVDMVGDLLGMSGQAHYQRKNMRAAAELQHEENKYWAEYNTPANQMARLKAAGLNPNLVYGNGADAQFVGSVNPSGSMPHMKGGYGTDFMTMQNLSAQNQNLMAQNDMYKNLARLYGEQADSEHYDNTRKQSQDPVYMGWIDKKRAWQEYLNSVGTGERIQSESMLNDSIRNLHLLTYNIDSETRFQIQHELLRSYGIQNAIAELEKESFIPRLRAELKLEYAQAAQCEAQIANLKALADLYNAETDQTKLSSYGQMIQNGISELEKEFTDWNVRTSTTGWATFWNKWIGPVTGNLGKLLGGSTQFQFGGKSPVKIGGFR